MSDIPPLKPRPKLHSWLHARGLGPTWLAERWKISPQAASRYLLPFAHDRRVIPSEVQMGDVLDFTDGEVGAADWYPAALTRNPMPASIGALPETGQ
jgi:hypothetical protein